MANRRVAAKVVLVADMVLVEVVVWTSTVVVVDNGVLFVPTAENLPDLFDYSK